jgi:hypothetical protein
MSPGLKSNVREDQHIKRCEVNRGKGVTLDDHPESPAVFEGKENWRAF